MIDAWRLVKARYAESAFTGEGARRYGGRFNSVGTAVVYTAESLALAELEILVNLPSERLLETYVAFRLGIEAALVEALPPDRLPVDWRREPAPQSVKRIGDAWVRSGRSMVLRVPSAVVPSESNYLINPSHPDFERLEIAGPIDPLIDSRLR